MSNLHIHLNEGLITAINWTGIGTGIAGVLLAEDNQRNIMFFVGVIAGITTIVRNVQQTRKKEK